VRDRAATIDPLVVRPTFESDYTAINRRSFLGENLAQKLADVAEALHALSGPALQLLYFATASWIQ